MTQLEIAAITMYLRDARQRAQAELDRITWAPGTIVIFKSECFTPGRSSQIEAGVLGVVTGYMPPPTNHGPGTSPTRVTYVYVLTSGGEFLCDQSLLDRLPN
jgi:hypothetical protein